MMDKLGQALLQTGQLLVIRASAVAKLGRKFVTNWATLLQYGASITTRGNYYKVGRYTLVTLGQIVPCLLKWQFAIDS